MLVNIASAPQVKQEAGALNRKEVRYKSGDSQIIFLEIAGLMRQCWRKTLGQAGHSPPDDTGVTFKAYIAKLSFGPKFPDTWSLESGAYKILQPNEPWS